jgi:hypothetical protein
MNKPYKIGGFRWCAEIAQREAIQDMLADLHRIFKREADSIVIDDELADDTQR